MFLGQWHLLQRSKCFKISVNAQAIKRMTCARCIFDGSFFERCETSFLLSNKLNSRARNVECFGFDKSRLNPRRTGVEDEQNVFDPKGKKNECHGGV